MDLFSICCLQCVVVLACVDVDSNGDEEDCNEAEVDDGMDENGYSTGLKVAEVDDSVPSGQLK